MFLLWCTLDMTVYIVDQVNILKNICNTMLILQHYCQQCYGIVSQRLRIRLECRSIQHDKLIWRACTSNRMRWKVPDCVIYSTNACCQFGNNSIWQSMAWPYSSSLAEGTTSDQCKETDHSEGERHTTNWGLRSWIAQVFLACARTAGYMWIVKAWNCFVLVIFALVLVMNGTSAYRSFERNANHYSK